MNVRKHKKKILAVGVLCLIVLLILCAPLALRPALRAIVRANGFPRAEIGAAGFTGSGIYIDKILFDANGFSSAEGIQVDGSVVKILFARSAGKISVKDIELSGELDSGNRLTIAGWDGTLPPPAKKIFFENLFIDGLTLDLDTKAGAIQMEARASVDRDKSGAARLTGSITADQNQLSAHVSLSGVFDALGDFSGKADISDASLAMDDFSISRVSGWVEIHSLRQGLLDGQIVAGGMKYLQTPFEDVNLIFDTARPTVLIAKTKVKGRDVRIGAEASRSPERKFTLTCLAPSLADLAAVAGLSDTTPDKRFTRTGAVQLTLLADADFFLKPEVSAATDIFYKDANSHTRARFTVGSLLDTKTWLQKAVFPAR